MSDELLPWYNSELRFIRRMGQQFARDNQKIAGRLGLGSDVVEDPHVGRLIEAFAYLNARTRHKIDDDLPEITEAFLNVLYPHYLSPIPSMAISQFRLNQSQAEQTSGQVIKAGTQLETAPVDGEPCRFRCASDVQLWPIRVSDSSLTHGVLPAVSVGWMKSAKALLELALSTYVDKVSFSQLPLESLRFFIKAQPADAYLIYELLFNNVAGIAICSGEGSKPIKILDSLAIKPVGFSLDEMLLPTSARSFPGYTMLTEFFAFPEKFLFFELDLSQVDLAEAGSELKVRLYLDREVPDLEPGIDRTTFQTGCTPVINLFTKTAEPIRLTQTEFEYPVVADLRRQKFFEVYSIDQVTASASDESVQEYRPFYSIQHGDNQDKTAAYWYAARRDSDSENDLGSDLWLSLVDLKFQPEHHNDRTVRVQTTCFNRDLPQRLPFGNELPLQITEQTGGVVSAACITRPTVTLRPPLKHGTRWRLISHLNLNGLSLTDFDSNGAGGFREILSLYDFADSTASRGMIAGLLSVITRRTTGRVSEMIGQRKSTFICRGIETTLHFDEDQYTGSVFLFASVLERFLSLYCSVNSFVRTVATTEQREESLHKWPPRSGDQLVL